MDREVEKQGVFDDGDRPHCDIGNGKEGESRPLRGEAVIRHAG